MLPPEEWAFLPAGQPVGKQLCQPPEERITGHNRTTACFQEWCSPGKTLARKLSSHSELSYQLHHYAALILKA